MKRFILVLLFILLFIFVLFFASCATNQSISIDTNAGFFLGLWHGFIAIFAFIGSLFSEKIAIYYSCNNGKFYDLGYIIGFFSLIKLIRIYGTSKNENKKIKKHENNHQTLNEKNGTTNRKKTV